MKCLFIFAIAVLFTVSPNWSAPISFNTALPVHEGGILLRTQVIEMKAENDPSTLDREMNVISIPLILVYGVSSKLALMGVVPYMDKELKIKSQGVTRSASGLGDVMTLARYQVFERNRSGQTVRGAVFGGLKLPSGDDNKQDSLGLLPRPVQPGTGSFDPFIGTVWTGQWLTFQVDSDLSYRWNTEAEDFKFGDVVAQNTSFQFRLWPRALKSKGVPQYLYGVLEFNQTYKDKNELNRRRDSNSGGYQLFITPGVQWVAKRVIFEVASQLPAVQSLNGEALETDYHLIGSVRLWF